MDRLQWLSQRYAENDVDEEHHETDHDAPLDLQSCVVETYLSEFHLGG